MLVNKQRQAPKIKVNPMASILPFVALANASAASAGMGGPWPVDGPKPSSLRAPSTGGAPQV